MSERPRLSICLPTNSSLERSRQTLQGLQMLVQSPEIESVISDNSGDTRKREVLRPLVHDRFRYVESPEPEALRNWEFGLRQVRGDYCCFLSDDDLLVALPGFSTKSLSLSGGNIGFRPQMALCTEELGIYSITNYGIEAPDAIGRMKQYLALNAGANTTLFSFYRTELLRDLYAELAAFHPTCGGFCDWAIVMGLLSMGKLPALPQMLYVYNNRNWDTQENIARNAVKTFVDAGLPEDTARISPILQGLDCFGMICRAASPIPALEKLEAAFFVLEGFIRQFSGVLSREGAASLFGQERWDFSTRLVDACTSHVDQLAASLLIVDKWLPGYAERYQSYFLKTLDRELVSIIQ